jgi:hypothetical protein
MPARPRLVTIAVRQSFRASVVTSFIRCVIVERHDHCAERGQRQVRDHVLRRATEAQPG